MIAIATGRKDLDEAIKEKIDNGFVVNYKEFLIDNEEYKFEIVIISKHLKGTTTTLEELLFELKQNNIRVIYLTHEEMKNEIKLCLNLNIYDIIFDPIEVSKIINVIQKPMRFSDISKLYLKIINEEDIEEEKSFLKNILKKKSEEEGIIRRNIDKGKDGKVKIIEKEVIISQSIGAITIAVGGTKIGAGTTSMAVTIAKYLKTINKKVALAELNNYPALNGIGIPNIDVYSQEYIGYKMKDPKNVLNDINIDNYKYIVLDLGSLYQHKSESECNISERTAENSIYFHEMNRSHISILVHPGGEWNLKYLLPFSINNDVNKKWKIVLMHTNKIDKRIKDEFNNTYIAPYNLNIKNDETVALLEKILKEIITIKKGKNKLRNKLSLLIKKGG